MTEQQADAAEQEAAAEDAPAAAGGAAPPPPTGPEAALQRYQQRLRRGRIVYFGLIAVVLAGIAVGVRIAWTHGEIAHASLHTIATPPSTVTIQAPTPTPALAWNTVDRIAIGAPQWGGTIITYSTHTIGGRDARTGKRTWTYTRTDRAVCTVAQASGTTMAIFANGGNCDEVSAFDSGTGQRRWERTLDFDARPINGTPAVMVTESTILIRSATTIYAIDPVSGLNRWTYYRYGCLVEHAVAGSSGVLISQNCSAQVQCSKYKYCAVGPQLFLRDGTAGTGDDSDQNADHILWFKPGDASVPASADANLVSAVSADGSSLESFDPAHGTSFGFTTLPPARRGLGPVTPFATDGDELLWIGGRTFAIRAGAVVPDWTVPAETPPAVQSTDGSDPPQLSTARITVLVGSAVGILDGSTGQLVTRFDVAVPRRATVSSLGTGFLVASSSGIVAYR